MFLRGHNGPGGFILRNIPDEPDKTEFIWILNTDIKVIVCVKMVYGFVKLLLSKFPQKCFFLLQGWLPSRLVEQSLGGVMVNTVRDIRKYLLTMPSA